MKRLTEAQHRVLHTMPMEWQMLPLHGGTTLPFLIREGFVETRIVDVTPVGTSPQFRNTETQVKITEKGKTALHYFGRKSK